MSASSPKSQEKSLSLLDKQLSPTNKSKVKRSTTMDLSDVDGKESEIEVMNRREYLLRIRWENEIVSNKMTIKRMEGKRLTMGSIVQLQHLDSNQFITIQGDRAAMINNSCSMVKLDDCGINGALVVQPGLT